jgi:hypothetical protein
MRETAKIGGDVFGIRYLQAGWIPGGPGGSFNDVKEPEREASPRRSNRATIAWNVGPVGWLARERAYGLPQSTPGDYARLTIVYREGEFLGARFALDTRLHPRRRSERR